MKRLVFALVLVPVFAHGVTTTLEYEDSREAASRAAISNEITSAVGAVPIAGNYAAVSNAAMSAIQSHQPLTNFYTRAETESKIVELAPAPGNYATVSNAAMSASAAVSNKADAVRVAVDDRAVVACAWWDGEKLLTWNGSEWIWGSGLLGGARSLLCYDGLWEYSPSVTPFAYTNAVPIYGLPPSLVLYEGGDSVTLTRTNEVYGVATNAYPVAYVDDVARATDALAASVVSPGELASAVSDLSKKIPNNITRTATDATLVHCDDGTCTNAILYIRQANGSLAGLMTAADKTKIDNLSDVASSGDYNDLENKPTIPATAADVGAYSAADGATLAGQVATIGAHLNAEDARFVVTNYNSETHTPEAYVEIQLPDESWSRIWSEMTRWNWLFDYFLPTNYYGKAAIDAALAEKADRAWGFYDSTTGAYAPDGYTWISSEKIAIAANLAYQRTITTEGAIWVLESNGTVTETGGLTNGFFRISDDEGNSLFEIVKGNKRTIGADASSCQIVAGFTPTKLQIGYSIVSDVHPTLYVCESLVTQNWKAETDSDCVATVSWSGTSGAYVAQVQGKSACPALFVKATYEVGGETYISNSAPVSMQYMMIDGVKYAVGTATISGNTVLTLTVAP